MKRSSFLMLTAAFASIFGAGMLVAPEIFFSRYGLALNNVSSLFARSLGSALVAIAVITWMARNAGDSAALRGILAGNLVIHVIGLVLDVSAVSAGTINTQGWGSVILHVAFAGGFSYYLFALNKGSK